MYLAENRLIPQEQSAYRKHHSTETAVLKVLSDAYTAADVNHVTLLCMLDLSAAFDTVDHEILFVRLHHLFGLGGRVLEWFHSYLTGRSLSVWYNGEMSNTVALLYGVPRGSVLGPRALLS